MTENAWNEPLATPVARRLKIRIREDTGLTASAGVAPNKFLAKIASGWKKPDGLTVISPDRVEPFLQKLPVDALWGVGPVTARKLRARGIERLVDVRTLRPGQPARDGRQPRRLAAAARQRHRRPAGCRQPRDQVVGLGEHLRRGPDRHPTRFARRSPTWPSARRHGSRNGDLLARTVTVKVRYSDFTTITRSHSAAPTRDEAAILARSLQLLERTDAGHRPVRLLGVSVHNLCTRGGRAARRGARSSAVWRRGSGQFTEFFVRNEGC